MPCTEAVRTMTPLLRRELGHCGLGDVEAAREIDGEHFVPEVGRGRDDVADSAGCRHCGDAAEPAEAVDGQELHCRFAVGEIATEPIWVLTRAPRCGGGRERLGVTIEQHEVLALGRVESRRQSGRFPWPRP